MPWPISLFLSTNCCSNLLIVSFSDGLGETSVGAVGSCDLAALIDRLDTVEYCDEEVFPTVEVADRLVRLGSESVNETKVSKDQGNLIAFNFACNTSCKSRLNMVECFISANIWNSLHLKKEFWSMCRSLISTEQFHYRLRLQGY